jgi:hypothetical protein
MRETIPKSNDYRKRRKEEISGHVVQEDENRYGNLPAFSNKRRECEEYNPIL